MHAHRKPHPGPDNNPAAKTIQREFDGPDFNPRIDGERLGRQHERIRDLMLDRKWRTLSEIASLLGYPESSISAQLRHLRKPRFGSYEVLKRRRGNGRAGTFEYRVDPPTGDPQLEFGGVA